MPLGERAVEVDRLPGESELLIYRLKPGRVPQAPSDDQNEEQAADAVGF